jgi:hypothetical protein
MTKSALTSVSDNKLGTLIHLNDQQANQAITSGAGPTRCILEQDNSLRQFWFISWLNLQNFCKDNKSFFKKLYIKQYILYIKKYICMYVCMSTEGSARPSVVPSTYF